jgi:hypothetical protein
VDKRIERITRALPLLTTTQLKSIDEIVTQFQRGYLHISKNEALDFISDSILLDFGDMLRLHHCFSKGPFSKDKFEYGLELVFNQAGQVAELAPAGNPTFDITINAQKYSLKTEAAKAIKLDLIHISKFMELGKGVWEDKVDHLVGLLDRFLDRVEALDRVLILRNTSKAPWTYELVEIPKDLLLKARVGELHINSTSKQNPKPGCCEVLENGERLFQLYFDGGTERKLQIKYLQKKLCSVHATWVFDVNPIQSEIGNDSDSE